MEFEYQSMRKSFPQDTQQRNYYQAGNNNQSGKWWQQDWPRSMRQDNSNQSDTNQTGQISHHWNSMNQQGKQPVRTSEWKGSSWQ
jgi:hypothetical protein